MQTYPSLRASPVKLLSLLPTFAPCLLVVLHGIQDIIAIQTGEEPIPTFPAAFTRRSIGGNTAAVGGFCFVGGPREPAHFVGTFFDVIAWGVFACGMCFFTGCCMFD